MKSERIVKTCGKLYLAGEYAVLSPGQAALIKNIPIFMTGRIQPAVAYHLASDMFNHQASLEPDADYALIQETIAVMNDWLLAQRITSQPFSLTISGKMEREGRKFGIGSSGSVVILTLKAMAAFYRLNVDAEQLFKLAAFVLLRRGDNGSVGDLACIVYEDLVYYRSFDRAHIRKQLASMDMMTVLAQDWGYQIRRIQPALACDFLVGWTKEPAISKDLVEQVKSAIDDHFLSQTQQQVNLLAAALTGGDKMAVKASLEEVSSLLAGLSPAIYTAKLSQLKAAAEGLDCVAKSSGAGGGDCGIALVFNVEDKQILLQRWQLAGIELLHQERMGEYESES